MQWCMNCMVLSRRNDVHGGERGDVVLFLVMTLLCLVLMSVCAHVFFRKTHSREGRNTPLLLERSTSPVSAITLAHHLVAKYKSRAFLFLSYRATLVTSDADNMRENYYYTSTVCYQVIYVFFFPYRIFPWNTTYAIRLRYCIYCNKIFITSSHMIIF